MPPSSSLVAISRETLPQFLQRIGGRASIVSIASRFGWDLAAARREARLASASGRIVDLQDDWFGIASPLQSAGAERGPRLQAHDHSVREHP